ncbi:hypothetical protein AKO1_013096 [Acrasis kona]|uniref:EGF-like domain-containing protein n=1 Tax=Acrasis kona TaxID=1008807 RepID=A0AAW2YZL6_9EUKA
MLCTQMGTFYVKNKTIYCPMQTVVMSNISSISHSLKSICVLTKQQELHLISLTDGKLIGRSWSITFVSRNVSKASCNDKTVVYTKTTDSSNIIYTHQTSLSDISQAVIQSTSKIRDLFTTNTMTMAIMDEKTLSCSNPTLYGGPNCTTPICYGSDDLTVSCSGHGICVAPNQCQCTSSHYGDACQIPPKTTQIETRDTTQPTTTHSVLFPPTCNLTISGPTSIGACETTFSLTVYSDCTFPQGYPFEWSVPTNTSNLINEILSAQSTNSIQMISSFLPINTTLPFKVTFLNVSTTIHITRTLSNIPTFLPIQQTPLTFYLSKSTFILRAVATICVSDALRYEWTLVSRLGSPTNIPIKTSTSSTLIINGQDFKNTQGTNIYSVTAYVVNDKKISTTTSITVNAQYDNLVPIITGGQRIVTNSAQSIILDGSESYDPVQSITNTPLRFTWSCKDSKNNKCPDTMAAYLSYMNSINAAFVVYPYEPGEGQYQFGLTVTKNDARSSNTSTKVTVVQEQVPMVSIRGLPQYTSKSQRVILTGSCSKDYSSKWSVVDGNFTLTSDKTLTRLINRTSVVNNLVLKAGVLPIGPLTMRLTCGHGYAQLSTTIKAGPRNGRISIEPSTGAAFKYILTTFDWSSDTSIEYYFTFVTINQEQEQEEVVLTQTSALNNAIVTLPCSAVKVCARAVDAYGSNVRTVSCANTNRTCPDFTFQQ